MNPRKYSIRILPVAEQDLNELVAYVAADNPKAALALAEKIEKSLNSLTKHPHLGRIPRDEDISRMGYRYLIVENYLIFYTMEGKIILVRRILHGARDYRNLL